MEPCPECGFDWETTSDALIGALRAARLAFAEAVAGRDTETARRRPAPDTWSVIEYVGHTADGVGWYDERIIAVLEHDRPQLVPFDWDVFTEQRRYDLRPMSELLDAIEQQCQSLAMRLDALDDEGWTRTGIGSDGGDRTVLALARRAVHEVHHHLDDVRRQ